jgi:hypothetical protein
MVPVSRAARHAAAAVSLLLAAAALAAAGTGCHVDDTGKPVDGGANGGADAGTLGAFPFIRITSSPSGAVTGAATVTFDLFDMAGAPVAVTATWLAPSSAQQPASPGLGSNLLAAVDTTPEGVSLTFSWDSMTDFPGDLDAVEICLQGTSASGVGELACTPPFDLRNAVPGADQVRLNEVLTGNADQVELVNLGTVAVNVRGFQLAWTDDSGLAGALTVPVDYMLNPGALVVLRENTGAPGANVIDLGENISWSNATGGSAALLNQVGQGLDFVRWGGSNEPPPAPTAWSDTAGLPTPPDDTTSLSRVGADDTNADADFCLTLATAGADNGACLVLEAFAPGDLTITEISIASLDWVEVLNTSGGTVNVLGVRLLWSSMLGSGVVVLPNLTLMPGGRLVVTDDAGTPGATVVVGPENFAWAPFAGGGTATLADGYGTGVDFVRWGTTDTTAPPAGVAWSEAAGVLRSPANTTTLTRNPEDVDDDTTADFCVAAPTFDAPNGPCLPDASAATLLITEVGCGSPDWVEVTNTGAADVDLLGWQLVWGRGPGGMGAMGGLLSIGSYVLAPGERVVLADGDMGLTNQIDFSGMGFGTNIGWGAPSLYVGAALLVDPYLNGEDYLRWGGSTALIPADITWSEPGGGVAAPASDTDVLNRDEALGDNDVDTDWCVLTVGSPGVANPACQ